MLYTATQKKSITVIGPTASGKSTLAIQLAQIYDGEVISSDSRQIYRGMSIGTGKEPGRLTTSQKRGVSTHLAYISDGVPHYMIDILHPNTPYNINSFIKKATRMRDDIWQRQKIPFIAGGTLFWAQGLLQGDAFPIVPPNIALRKRYKDLSADVLFKKLKTRDPKRACDIKSKNEVNNKHRLIRALEIVRALGAVPPVIQKTQYSKDEHLILALEPSKDILYKKMECRMDKWFNHGIFDEILTLHKDMHVPWTRLESFGLEYKWCVRYMRGNITYIEMRDNTLYDLKKYAKRQMTWIRRWRAQGAPIVTVASLHDAKKYVSDFL